MNALLQEVAGVVWYALLTSLLLWFLFRAPLPRSSPRRRVPKWVAVAVFVAVGAGVLAGMGYELFVKKAPPPCPCGVPGCPEPPACDVEHEKYMPTQ